MRSKMMLVLGLAWIAGCAHGPLARNRDPLPPTNSVPDQIVARLDHNSRAIRSVEFSNVSIQVKQGSQTLGVNGMLAYQKPRNFRLMAEALGSTQADIGSNEREFWFWFKGRDAPLYRCSYEDYPQVRALAIPLHPDWIAEALCVQEFGTTDAYKVRDRGAYLDLISQWTSPQGQQLQKITVIARRGPNAGRVVGHYVRDAQGKDVWSAEINEYRQVDGLTIPRKITLRCPSQKLEVKMKMDGPRLNHLVSGKNYPQFERPSGYREIDLARGPVNSSSPIRRVGGTAE